MKTLQKMGIFLLAAAMLFQITACAANTAAPVFADVPSGADYAQAVAWCAENGLMNGVDDGGNFDPDGSMTRAMLATVLYRQAGQPRVGGDPAFTDALPGVWYSDAVVWAAEKELLRGYGDGRFGVNDPVSKEMLTVVMARQNGKNPAWTGVSELAVNAKRSEAAVALYETFHTPEAGGGSTAATLAPAPTAALPSAENKTLVAYFSATNTTRPLAEYAADILGADLYEIVPETPYTKADLAYYTDCRTDREQSDPNARPTISGKVENMDGYDVVLIGYPIWHGQPPRIISTFLESYDFTGKTIVPFCTSGSSGYSDSSIKPLAPGANWLTGRRFPGGTSRSTMEEWIATLDLPTAPAQEDGKMYIQIGDTVWTATLESNPSAAALKELLAKGPLTVDMSDYGGFEKVGSLGVTLPQTNAQITTKPGDIILYQGNSITIYYDKNSWNFTLLGHIDGVTDAELRNTLKAGGDNVSVTFSLEAPQKMGA